MKIKIEKYASKLKQKGFTMSAIIDCLNLRFPFNFFAIGDGIYCGDNQVNCYRVINA